MELKSLHVHMHDCPDLSDSTAIVPWPSPNSSDFSTYPLRFFSVFQKSAHLTSRLLTATLKVGNDPNDSPEVPHQCKTNAVPNTTPTSSIQLRHPLSPDFTHFSIRKSVVRSDALCDRGFTLRKQNRPDESLCVKI